LDEFQRIQVPGQKIRAVKEEALAHFLVEIFVPEDSSGNDLTDSLNVEVKGTADGLRR
jgi:hypothetical protein